eukprot:448013_1
MSTNQFSTKWIDLNSFHCADTTRHYITIPTGIDKNNYYVSTINSIHKYNIENDKWSKINGLDNYHLCKQSRECTPAFNVKKQILFLLDSTDQLTEIQLNNQQIKTHNNIDINGVDMGKSIIIDGSLFIVGERVDYILEFNITTKQWAKLPVL